MYSAVHTGAVKINRLPAEFFDDLFAVNEIQDVSKIITNNHALLGRVLADQRLPNTTRSLLNDLVVKAKAGKLRPPDALKAVSLLYSMVMRGGGNSQITWTVFRKGKAQGLRFLPGSAPVNYSTYALHPDFLEVGQKLFETVESSGSAVLSSLSQGLLNKNLIPWARVDYRLTKPINSKMTLGIVDVGMGGVGTFEKDHIAEKHGFASSIGKQFVECLLHLHAEKVGGLPNRVVIALPEDYFSEDLKQVVRSSEDLKALGEKFANELGSGNVHIAPYSKIAFRPKGVSITDLDGSKKQLGDKDFILVYNPNKPMKEDFEKGLQKSVQVFGNRQFTAISDKRKNGPFILAGEVEGAESKIIVPKRGGLIEIASEEVISPVLEGLSALRLGTGLVLKLPMPVEQSGKALPSALFLNPHSPIQRQAAAREIKRYFHAGARQLTAEELIPPHSVSKGGGGVELRLYYGGK